jgi:two-component system phosphate regulon sensor histidine kinase PhoR
MPKRRLQWRIYPAYLSVALTVIVVLCSFAAYSMRKAHVALTVNDLEIRARLLLQKFPTTLPSEPSDDLTLLIRSLAVESQVRITLVTKSGRVIADSPLSHGSESLLYSPEVHEALAGQGGVAQRYSSVLRTELLYVALPIVNENAVAGAIRVSVPLSMLTAELRDTNVLLAVTGVFLALIAAVVVFIITRRITRPIEQMKKGAEEFASGDFSLKLSIPDSAEFAGLAVALNDMAEQLNARIQTVTAQRTEQEAILSSLREGVIALDQEERILYVNRTAAELLDVNSSQVRNRLMQAVVRGSELQRFISSRLSGEEYAAETVVLSGVKPGQVLQVGGAELRDAAGRLAGLVVVLNDITRLQRLENMRRDFVANVSHELKTPIASIKGYVETLREGAMDDPQALVSFLDRLAHNAERLNAIVDDLLLLSRIEQDGEQGLVQHSDQSLRAIVESAITSCQDKADERQVTLALICQNDLTVRANPTLLEQAVGNLLDNAIKYSDSGKTVEITVTREGDEAVIHVRDYGCGIEAEHLPRLFERFYRVDRARSRKLGGTGLGLAIVKHIVQTHGGSVVVESTPTLGSTFSIHLLSTNS